MTVRDRASIGVGVLALALIVLATQLPAIGAGGLLHPMRSRVRRVPPAGCQDTTYQGDGVSLKGWYCRTDVGRRGTLIYLHGIADNRTSVAGIVERFRRRGFDVVAYDSRAHGESDGDICTYGFYEKRDLSLVLDALEDGPIVVVGTSLGAAVAVQGAAVDSRISAVIAAEIFSDLRTIAAERAPFFFTAAAIEEAIRLAERRGRFQIQAVSPSLAASKVKAPVLVIHGAADRDTPPDHSRRVFEALPGAKRLILVPAAGHNESLRGTVWDEIERWIAVALSSRTN